MAQRWCRCGSRLDEDYRCTRCGTIEAACDDAAAARDAAWAALKPTVQHLQTSAIVLIERMIEAKETSP